MRSKAYFLHQPRLYSPKNVWFFWLISIYSQNRWDIHNFDDFTSTKSTQSETRHQLIQHGMIKILNILLKSKNYLKIHVHFELTHLT
jgi:hypothetical protein